MYINKIIKLKNNKYKIFIDNDYLITYDSVILENNLLYKKHIDKELYKKIIFDTKYYDVYNSTIKYLLKKRRSEKEVIIYLDKFDINDSQKDSLITKLKQINLINDNEYCRAYINDKIYLGKVGINKIKRDLLNQNISLDIINQNISSIDDNIMKENLEKLIQKKIKTNNKYSNSYLKQKILNEMTSIGYSREDVIFIINKYLVPDDNLLEKEFNKLYNKLLSRYSEGDLLLKIKQKLIQKGFNKEDINKIIESNNVN